jgi:Flp pilus assembly protein TadD
VPEAVLDRARALIDLGRWQQALEVLRPALADPQAGGEPWCLQARCELGLGRTVPAHEAAQRAVAVDPYNEWGFRLLAVCALRMGRHDEALATCQQALLLHPDLCEGLHLLTTIRLAQPRGRPEAERVAQHNLQVNPDRALSWEGAADVAAAGKRWPEVEAYARRGLAIDPHDADLAMALGHALARQGRAGEAGDAYAAAARSDPTSHRARQAIGRIGLPVAGAGLMAVKFFGLVAVLGAAAWARFSPWLLLVAALTLGGLVWGAMETMSWRARRQLTPQLRTIAVRERRASDRGLLALLAALLVIVAIRALAVPDLTVTALTVLLIVALLVVRYRLPLPMDYRPGRLASAGHAIRRRFR